MLQGFGQLGPVVLLAALGLRLLGQEFPVPSVQAVEDSLPLCLKAKAGGVLFGCGYSKVRNELPGVLRHDPALSLRLSLRCSKPLTNVSRYCSLKRSCKKYSR